jgi:hypothetical protein
LRYRRSGYLCAGFSAPSFPVPREGKAIKTDPMERRQKNIRELQKKRAERLAKAVSHLRKNPFAAKVAVELEYATALGRFYRAASARDGE